MTGESELLRQRQTEARRLAAIIRWIEEETPGCFGGAAAVIRRMAAGDDVAPDDLTIALAMVRLAMREREGPRPETRAGLPD